MPPRGVKKGTKRARQYEHIKEAELESGVSEERAEEIAARTVNKERARSGEARTSSRLSRTDARSVFASASETAVSACMWPARRTVAASGHAIGWG